MLQLQLVAELAELQRCKQLPCLHVANVRKQSVQKPLSSGFLCSAMKKQAAPLATAQLTEVTLEGLSDLAELTQHCPAGA